MKITCKPKIQIFYNTTPKFFISDHGPLSVLVDWQKYKNVWALVKNKTENLSSQVVNNLGEVFLCSERQLSIKQAHFKGGLQLNFGGIVVELRMKLKKDKRRYTRKPVSLLIGSGPPCCSGELSINYSLQVLIFNYP